MAVATMQDGTFDGVFDGTFDGMHAVAAIQDDMGVPATSTPRLVSIRCRRRWPIRNMASSRRAQPTAFQDAALPDKPSIARPIAMPKHMPPAVSISDIYNTCRRLCTYRISLKTYCDISLGCNEVLATPKLTAGGGKHVGYYSISVIVTYWFL